jgi:hypothetical protein
VLAADLDLHSIDGAHWRNWLHLLAPPAVLQAPSFALVIIDQGAVVGALIAGQGAVAPAEVPFAGTGPADLTALREALEVGMVIVLSADAVGQLHQLIESRLQLDQDYAAQGLVILRALKELSGAGVWTEPRLLELVPAPGIDPIQRTFDLLVPDNTALMAYVFEDDRSGVHASIIATKVDGNIDSVATHLAVADLVPAQTLARDWRSQHKRLVRAVEERFAKPSIAMFLDRGTWYRILTGPTDQLAREIRARNLIIDPAPAWLLGLLGAATVGAVAMRSASAIGKLLPESARRMASDWAAAGKEAIRDAGAGPFALLGFDPIELWMSMRHYYRPPRTP